MISIRKEKLNSYILGVFFFLILAYLELGDIAYYVIVAGSLMLGFRSLSSNKSTMVTVITFMIFLLVFILSFLRGTGFGIISYCIYTLVGVSISLFILNKRFNIPILLVAYSVISLYLIYKGINSISNFYNSDEAFFPGTGSSRNYISVLLLGLSGVLFLIEKKQGVKPTIWLTILCLLASFVAFNRSGIICSLLLVILIVYNRYKNIMVYGSVLMLLGLFFYVFIYYFGDIIDYIEIIDNLNEKGDTSYIENPRYELLNAYISQLDLTKIILGQNLSKISLISAFNNNPHNSYIRLLSTCGIVAFFYVYLTIKAILWYRKNDMLLLGIMLILFLRAWFDIVYYGSIYDFCIFTFMLFPLFQKKQNILAQYGQSTL